MVDSPLAAALMVTDVGFAESEKPAAVRIVTVRLVEFLMSVLVPPVPVSVTE
jgi:hypothetical protein